MFSACPRPSRVGQQWLILYFRKIGKHLLFRGAKKSTGTSSAPDIIFFRHHQAPISPLSQSPRALCGPAGAEFKPDSSAPGEPGHRDTGKFNLNVKKTLLSVISFLAMVTLSP